jgi:hypothetical protein
LNLNIQKFEFDQKNGYFFNVNTKKVATVGKEYKRRFWKADITGKAQNDVVGQHWVALRCQGEDKKVNA